MNTYNEYLLMVENAIAEINYPPRTPELFAPVKYGMESGGKRIRPVLLLATANALGREPESVLNQAVAIEMFHNFTLLHDDVMDNAAVRRGRPSVFKKWGLSEAILSGDAMCTLASELVMRGQEAETALRLIRAFNGAAIGVYEGQQLDIEFETRTDVTIEEYVEMVRLKTSVLLGAACNLGAIAANASEEVCAAFDDFATNLGIAFQLQDDYLDTFGDPEVFGKAIGGDILNEKKTWLFIQAVSENAGAMAEALKLEGQQKIEAVRSVYMQQGLDSRITNVIAEYTDKAQQALMKTGLNEADKSFFTSLAQKLTQRNK